MPAPLSKILVGLGVASTLFAIAWQTLRLPVASEWSPEEKRLIESLSLSRLPPLPADPSNALADDAGAAELGHLLYFDTRLPGTASRFDGLLGVRGGWVVHFYKRPPREYFFD